MGMLPVAKRISRRFTCARTRIARREHCLVRVYRDTTKCPLEAAHEMGGRKRRGRKSTPRVRARRSSPECETLDLEREEPLRVSSRLTYPFSTVDDHDEDEEEQEQEEEGTVELNVRPRFVFSSSLCAICLEESRVLCESCRMVSYCSTQHRAQDSSKHRDLCSGLTDVHSSIARTLSFDSGRNLDAEQYRAYRIHLLNGLEAKLQRRLDLWEREIVLYPRTCRGCRRFSDKLTRCSSCAMEYCCDDHATDHEKRCEEFRVFRRCLVLQHRHGCVTPKIPNVRGETRELKEGLTDANFDESMRLIYGNCAYYRRMDAYTYATLSLVSTIPLTALYSAQTCCSEWRRKTEWTVHVIGAEFQFEGTNLHVWEKLFLHLLPSARRLSLTLIGPELCLPGGVPPSLFSRIKLCGECKAAGRNVAVSFKQRTLYHEFESAEVADLVCAFNPGLYRSTGFAGKDTWTETIRKFCRASVDGGLAPPVVVTAYTVDEIHWEVARIKSVADAEVLLEPRRNPFASVKPDRNFVSDDVDPLIYKNYCISIVRGKAGGSVGDDSVERRCKFS